MTVQELDLRRNDEGFLLDAEQWTPEAAEALAEAEGIELTDVHWKVITFCREDAAQQGTPRACAASRSSRAST